MVYAYVQDVPIGEELYRRIITELGPEPLEGALLHLCVRNDDGSLRYIDVWESKEACGKAFENPNPLGRRHRVRRLSPSSRTNRQPPRHTACQRSASQGELVLTRRGGATLRKPKATQDRKMGSRVLKWKWDDPKIVPQNSHRAR